MKNNLIRLFTLVAALILLCNPVRAEENAHFSGSGTREDPYLITSSEDLIQLAADVNNGEYYENIWFAQTNDIDLHGIVWTPIGIYDSEYAFCGVYDGNGHNIWNMTTSASGNNGLFGRLGGTVMNLSLRGGSIDGSCCGSFTSHAYDSQAVILNCSSTASVSGYRAGGIADNFNGMIANCWTESALSAAEDGSVGGIVSYWASSVMNSYTKSDLGAYDFPEIPGVKILSQNTSNEELAGKLNKGLYKSAMKAGIDPRDLHYWILNDAGELFMSPQQYRYSLRDIPAYFSVLIVDIFPAMLAFASAAVLIIENHKTRKTRNRNAECSC